MGRHYRGVLGVRGFVEHNPMSLNLEGLKDQRLRTFLRFLFAEMEI